MGKPLQAKSADRKPAGAVYHNQRSCNQNQDAVEREAGITLYGKIISIEFRGELDWMLTIDGQRKQFMTYQAILSYLLNVLDKGKDPKKLALLREDMKNLISKCENLL